MLYENYQKKILRVAGVLAKIVRLLPLIITAMALVIATVVTLLAVKGTVGELSCSTEVVYGEQVQCEAKAFLSRVRYEYSADGSTWSEEHPRFPGNYWVRAVGNGSFGGEKYGEPKSFTVLPKKITVSVAESEIVYGDVLSLSADTVYNDVAACDRYITDDKWLATGIADTYPELVDPYGGLAYFKKLEITPDSKNITILDENGNDVTACYTFETITTDITLKYREITVLVESATHIYDGIPFSFEEYKLTGGSLKEGDKIIATFDDSLEALGWIKNSPVIKIVSENGIDVTGYYVIDEDFGSLNVEPRPLIIETGSREAVYRGSSLNCYDYQVDPNTTLIEGHSLKVVSGTSVKDCGEYENFLDFRIVDENGIEKTEYYSIVLKTGTIKITPKKLEVFTGDGTWEYDGSVHNESGLGMNYYANGLLLEHDIMVEVINDDCTICDVGVKKNMCEVVVYDWGSKDVDDVTRNYEIEYKYGKLEVTPRPLTVTTPDDYWIYDGEEHSSTKYSYKGRLSFHTVEVKTDPVTIRDLGTVENKVEIKLVDKDGKDKTENYSITYKFGTLEIAIRPVSLRTQGYTWIYDGEAHTWEEFYPVSELGIVDGEFLEITGWASVTDAGSTDNTIGDYVVYRKNNKGDKEDISFNYSIDWSYEKLTVDPRPISCKPVDVEKVYDDTVLVPEEVEVAEDSPFDLVAGHTLSAKLNGGRIDAGTSDSTIKEIKVMNGEDDISYNYAVEKLSGLITVHQREITVYTGSAVKEDYDGYPLTCDDYGVLPDKLYPLVEGHNIYLDIIGSQTEIGESENTCDETKTVILSPTRDVTRNYIVNYKYGTLLVKPVAVIYITSASDWKYYDGTPLTNETYEYRVSDGEMIEGHALSVKISGTITENGKLPNTMEVRVVDRFGKDVSRLYKIVSAEGMLEIREMKEEEDHNAVFGQIKTGKGGYIYLRERSYGNYNGKGWNPATPYWKTLPGGYSYNYLASIALSNAGQTEDYAEFKEMLIHMLPYYLGIDGVYDIPTSDTVYSGAMSDYVASYYPLPSVEEGYGNLKGNLGEYADRELEYREFVYQNYLVYDQATADYMSGIIAEQGFDINDPLVIQKIAHYIQHAAKYDLKYDKAMDSEENVAIAFLETYKTGICVHYASAATLLYRVLGIPARYIEGFALQTKSDEFVEIKNPGHAWVEVYVDEVGWIQVEVTGGMSGSGGSGGGSGEGSGDGSEQPKEPITIKPKYQYKCYDGKPLLAVPELDAEGIFAELLEQGYSYTVEIEGSQTEIGRGVSKIIGFELYDPDSQRVTDNYEVTYEEGVLEVLPAEDRLIKVYMYQIQKFYDGTPLLFEDGDYEIIEMPEDLRLELSINISITDVGRITLSEINEHIDEYVTYRVYKDDKDVTEDYSLMFDTFSYGNTSYIPVKVDKRPITVTSASETKTDDGLPLENSEVTITKGSLAEGHKIVAVADGYIDFVGSVQNTIAHIKIVDKNDVDVTENYDISTVLGTLTIIPSDD